MTIRTLLAVITVSFAAVSSPAASVTLLPDWLAEPSVRFLRMLPDGKTFVGIDGTDVFHWSPSENRRNIGSIPERFSSLVARASDVSADGTAIIGYLGDIEYKASYGFTWTAASGAILTPISNDGSIFGAVPTGVSADGSVIVGNARKGSDPPFGPSVPVPFRWTAATGTSSLEFDGYVSGVSADGTSIFGSRKITETTGEAVRWNEQDGLEGLGFLSTNGLISSFAVFASGNGDVIVGYSFPEEVTAGPNIFRWTRADGMQQISPLGDTQHPIAISSDADVILGFVQHFDFERGAIGPPISTIWSKNTGLHTLPELLSLNNLSAESVFGDVTKTHAFSGISADGRTIFGTSTRMVGGGTIDDPIPTFYYEHWLLKLSPVPEYSSFSLLLIGSNLIAFGRFRLLNHVTKSRFG